MNGQQADAPVEIECGLCGHGQVGDYHECPGGTYRSPDSLPPQRFISPGRVDARAFPANEHNRPRREREWNSPAKAAPLGRAFDRVALLTENYLVKVKGLRNQLRKLEREYAAEVREALESADE